MLFWWLTTDGMSSVDEVRSSQSTREGQVQQRHRVVASSSDMARRCPKCATISYTPRKYWVLERDRRRQLTQNVTLVNDVGDPRICKSLKRWRPRRDLNPCYRRESAGSDGKLLKQRNTDGYLRRFQYGIVTVCGS